MRIKLMSAKINGTISSQVENKDLKIEQLQGFMLLGLWPCPLFYCKPQGADKPTRVKLLRVTIFRQFR